MGRVITLQDIAGASPTTQVRLPVAEDDEGRPRWREFRAPRYPPRISQGPLQWSHTDPLQDFAWSMDDWSGGALAAWARPNDNRYQSADGVDLRWEGVAALGMTRDNGMAGSAYRNRIQYTDFIIKDAGFESGATTSWTDPANATFTVVAAAAHLGTYGGSLVTPGNLIADTSLLEQNVVDATESPVALWKSREVTFNAYVKTAVGSTTVELSVDDGVGSTDGTASTASGSWERISVTHTMNADSTGVTLKVQVAAGEGGSAATIYVDDFSCVPTGGVVCAGVAEYSGRLYAVFGRCIMRWDETNKVWRAVYIHASAAATDIVHFAANVFVAFGAGVAYLHGSGTTWTARSTGDTDAIHFAVARNANGTPALWKNDAADTVKSTTDPTEAGAAWTSGLTVGSTDHAINRLYGAFDTLVVGKEDGLYGFVRWDPTNSAGDNLVYEITSETTLFPSADNFADGVVWNGWLWLTTAQGLARWRPGYYENLSRLVHTPRAVVGLSRIRALGAGEEDLWAMHDTNRIDGSALKQPYLISIQAYGDALRLHTLQQMPAGPGAAIGHSPSRLALFHDGTTAQPPQVWSLGRSLLDSSTEWSASCYRWRLPVYGGPPFSAPSPTLEVSGSFDTPVWHGEMPSTPKAFAALTILCAGLGANQTIKVEYGLDGEAVTTHTLGTFSGTGTVQTLYFHNIAEGTPATNAVGRAIQLRFTFATNSYASTPKLYAIALHSTLRPERLKTWEVFVRTEDEAIMETGFAAPEAKQTLLAALNTLETQTYPVVLIEGLDDDTSLTSTTVFIVDRERVEEVEGAEIHRLLLQEANTS